MREFGQFAKERALYVCTKKQFVPTTVTYDFKRV